MAKQKVLLAWGAGKESCVSLFELKSPDYKIKGLISIFDETSNRLLGHGLREEIIDAQMKSLELPLTKVKVKTASSRWTDESALSESFQVFKRDGGQGISFGDHKSDELKKLHESGVQKTGLNYVSPVWNWKSQEVLRVLLGLGYKAIISGVNPQKISAEYLGKPFDQSFIDKIPSGIDPCGDGGEFRTFVFNGPFFQRSIEYKLGDRFESGGLVFVDIKPVTEQ